MQGAPSAIACSGCVDAARRDHHVACRRWWRSCRPRSWCSMPPRDSSEPDAPAIASISGVMRGTSGDQLAPRAFRRRLVVKPVDVGQQHQQVGAHHGGDARGEPVVVAVADLDGRHRVVLVDHRHAAPFQQLVDGRARVEIAAALFGVAEREQHLAGVDVVRARATPPRSAPARSGRRRRRPALSSSLSAPAGSLSTARPSAIAPDDTTSTSPLSLCSAAMSAASESSQSRLSAPAEESTSSEEPTFTTMRRKEAREGVWGMRHALYLRAVFSTAIAPASPSGCRRLRYSPFASFTSNT